MSFEMAGLSTLPAALRTLRPVRTLENNLAKGRLPHAILLKGEDLAVLESVAGALADSLLKSAGKAESHPDFFTLRPAGKARFIVVGRREGDEPNTMRHLIRELNQSSNQGGYKVALVYEVDRMNASAANAFLKTLEEPPKETLILLLTTRPYDVIETIRSRCFQFKIPAKLISSEAEEWQEWLREYRAWIHWLHRHPDEARAKVDKAVFMTYGLISRLVGEIETQSAVAWEAQQEKLSDSLSDEEIDALRVGLQKAVRDKLLIEVEENTRIAAIDLSHHVPFPADLLARAVASLESITGLLALNMRDDVALEGFFLESLKIWTS